MAKGRIPAGHGRRRVEAVRAVGGDQLTVRGPVEGERPVAWVLVRQARRGIGEQDVAPKHCGEQQDRPAASRGVASCAVLGSVAPCTGVGLSAALARAFAVVRTAAARAVALGAAAPVARAAAGSAGGGCWYGGGTGARAAARTAAGAELPGAAATAGAASHAGLATGAATTELCDHAAAVRFAWRCCCCWCCGGSGSSCFRPGCGRSSSWASGASGGAVGCWGHWCACRSGCSCTCGSGCCCRSALGVRCWPTCSSGDSAADWGRCCSCWKGR